MSFLLLFLGLTTSADASEFEGRTALGVEARVAKQWELGLAQNFRFDTNEKAGPELLTDLAVTWRPASAWRVGWGYRIGVKDIGSGPDPTHRTHLQGSWRGKWKPFQLHIREKLIVDLPGFKDDAELTARTRVLARFDVMFRPQVHVELHTPLAPEAFADRMRIGADVRLPVPVVDIDLGYFYQLPFDDDEPLHVAEIALTVPLDFRKKKKKKK